MASEKRRWPKGRITLVVLVILAALGFKRLQDNGGLPGLITSVIPYVPSHHLQTLAVYFMHVLTSWILPAVRSLGFLPADDCLLNDYKGDQLVSIAVSKGGSVVSAFVVWELVLGCGFSAAISGKKSEEWPPDPDVNSPFDADIYIAPGNTFNWPEYAYKDAQKGVHCIVYTRDPFDRFFSLYKYTFDGGESGLRKHSAEMQAMQTLEERLDYIWNSFGRETMVRTHATLLKSLEDSHGCTQIRMDDLIKGGDAFDGAMRDILTTWKIKPNLHAKLLKRLQSHDLTRQPKERLDANEHVSGRSISSQDKERIKLLMQQDQDIRDLLNRQRADLGYTAS